MDPTDQSCSYVTDNADLIFLRDALDILLPKVMLRFEWKEMHVC